MFALLCFALRDEFGALHLSRFTNSNFHVRLVDNFFFRPGNHPYTKSNSCILESMQFRIPFSDFIINEINVATCSTLSVSGKGKQEKECRECVLCVCVSSCHGVWLVSGGLVFVYHSFLC